MTERLHELRTENENAERASGPNPCPFGTFGIPPANSASRAGGMLKASRDRSLGTFGKNMKSPLPVVCFLVALVFCTGCRQSQESTPSLCIFLFRVIDADSEQPIIPYSCVNPASSFRPDLNPNALPKNMTLYVKDNEGVFACVSDTPAEIIIKADGYAESRITIRPADYLTSVSLKIPQDVRLKKLSSHD